MRCHCGERTTAARSVSIARSRSGVRAAGGWVSGSTSTTTAIIPTASATRNQKMTRHDPSATSHPPTMGATAGASPKIIVTRLMSRCAAAPS